MMRMSFLGALFGALLAGSAESAAADVLIAIDKSAQSMTVSVDGEPRYFWRVSTGMAGRETPAGRFQPFRMEAEHVSKEWDDAPMPHSIFFTRIGHAIHGSAHRLGSPVSHGCVRISESHAAILYGLVEREGLAKTHVVITGTEPLALDPRLARSDRSSDLPRDQNPPSERKLRRPDWLGEDGTETDGAYPDADRGAFYDAPYPGMPIPRAFPVYRGNGPGSYEAYPVYPDEPYAED